MITDEPINLVSGALFPLYLFPTDFFGVSDKAAAPPAGVLIRSLKKKERNLSEQ